VKKKILIVDDDHYTARFLAKRLRANNYEVMVEYDGVQGIKKAKERIPDLILLDMTMPQLGGIEVFKILTQLDVTKQIPIIFMAANPKLKMRKLVMKIGAKGIITKPFFSKDLELTIEMVINDCNLSESQHQHLQKGVQSV
jgi:DNA-binding response OmpR family regulator